MDVNKEIKKYLTQRKKEAIEGFLKLESPHPLFTKIFSELKKINPKKIQQSFLYELKKNCKEYWTNIDEGFNPDEKVRVLLFEYDDYKRVDPEAFAYGIIGENFKIKTKPYDFGYDYDFVSSIESTYGITLSTLSPLAKIGDGIPKEYKSVDFYEEEGYSSLRDSYLYTTYLILHDAIKDFTKSEEFRSLSREKILHFMIGEHDCSNEQPIYYDYENTKSIKKAIEEQGEPINDEDIESTFYFKHKIDSLIDEENAENIDEILMGLNLLIDNEITKSWAAMKLSNIYKKGFGVEIDIKKAINYMEIAAENGNHMAKANIASCYYTGQGKPKDLNKALELLIEADNSVWKGTYTNLIEQIKLELNQWEQ